MGSKGGCSCAGASFKPQNKCDSTVAPVAPPCLQEVQGQCGTDLNIVQGEDLATTICFSGMITQIRCINVDGSITTNDMLGNARKVRIACTGSDWQSIAGVYSVAGSDPSKKLLQLNGLDVAETKCFESVLRNIPGCRSTIAKQVPPTVIEHIDAKDWVFEGKIYTRRSSTTSRQLFGVYVTPGTDTLYFTYPKGKVNVGDSLCIYTPGQTIKAKALRVTCGETVDPCGETVAATFVEIDQIIGAVPEDSCVAMSVDAGVLVDLQTSVTGAGCVQVKLPWTETRDLPFLAYCDEPERRPDCDDTQSRFLGYWDLFATMSFLNPDGQLETIRKRVACGCVYVHSSSAGIYANCG
jgi:hypothetical protein